jgi:hypothetical protein
MRVLVVADDDPEGADADADERMVPDHIDRRGSVAVAPPQKLRREFTDGIE